MKKILLAFAVCITISFTGYTQTLTLSKQQTLDYITKLYKVNFGDGPSVLAISLDEKTLVVKWSSGDPHRKDLSKVNILEVLEYNDTVRGLRYRICDKEKSDMFLWGIQTESDAIRLKKALEHLIELVKAEKSTDPFDN